MRLSSVLLSMFLLVGCYTHVEPGHVGIQVESCGNGGVVPDPVGVGYHGVGPCTTIIEYPTFMQSVIWTHNIHEGHPVNEEITFSNADQMQIAADISLAYTIDPTKAPAFYSKFKADSLDSFTHGFLRNLAREKFDEVAGKFKIEAIMGDNSAFLLEVRTKLQVELTPYGVNINQFGFVGAPRPPAPIIEAINLKLAATQKAIQIENELRQSEAEAKKHIAQAEGIAKAGVAEAKGQAESKKIAADAEAYANRQITSSITPTLIEYRKAARWDGKLPQVTGANAMINLK